MNGFALTAHDLLKLATILGLLALVLAIWTYIMCLASRAQA
jgi:hypothetical protein